jgi:F420H(2)-dependent quinone reductase
MKEDRPPVEPRHELLHLDPAEQSGYLRFFYRHWRPTALGRIWSRSLALLSAWGLTPEILVALQVRDRRTGRSSSTVLVMVCHDGADYLVSMLGDRSEWVENIRAAAGSAVVRRGKSRPVRLTEIPADQRAPILKAWCRIATSGRKHLPILPDAPIAEFAKIAADYPVFRVDPAH